MRGCMTLTRFTNEISDFFGLEPAGWATPLRSTKNYVESSGSGEECQYFGDACLRVGHETTE
ncbi:hypothetical protein K2X89_13865, partial [Myxococcota bacterium]|nr:hypothetical protein [Myxococcota bacterium]